MKTTELIHQLNMLTSITATEGYGEIRIYRSGTPNKIGLAFSSPRTLIFTLPVKATIMLEGEFYAEDLGDTPIFTVGDIAKLLEEYIDTPLEYRIEPKLYNFVSTLPILKRSERKYLAYNKDKNDYALTHKKPYLTGFTTVFTEYQKEDMEEEGLLEGFEPKEIR